MDPAAIDPTLLTLDSFTQFGALGILAGVLFYGLKTALPKMVETLTKSNEAVQATLREQQDHFTEQQRTLARLGALLVQHDATVRGQNPETLGTTEELMDRVLR